MISIDGVPAGLREEDLFTGVSMPRNREIMRDYDRSIFTIADSYIRVSFKYVMGIDEQSVNSPRTAKEQSVNSPRTDKKISSRTVAHVSKTVSKEAIKANILS